jgi:N-acetylmuramoyl-L-alanine amidase
MLLRITAPLLFVMPIAAAAEMPGSERKEDAKTCLAEAVYYEARGEDETSREAVAHVVMNRTESEEFPDTVCGVVNQGCQFSYNCDGLPENLADEKSRAVAYDTAEHVLDGSAEDPTKGALFFHGQSLTPSWAHAFDRTASYGGHYFYR